MGAGADQQEQPGRFDVLGRTAGPVAHGETAQAPVAFAAGDLRAEPDRDVRGRVESLSEIARHRLLEGVAAHEHRDVAALAGEMQRRLARRVPATNDEHRLARERLPLGDRGAEVDARAREPSSSGIPSRR